MVLSDSTPLWIVMILFLFVGYIWSVFLLSEKKKSATLFMVGIATALQLLLCFGLYPALTAPLYSPRAMYGFGSWLALLCICTAEYGQKCYLKLSACILGWSFFTFAFTYGNALYVQKEYTEFRRELVVADLDNLNIEKQENPVIVQIEGSIGFSPIVQAICNEYPIIGRLVPITFQEKWSWGRKELFSYYGLKNIVWDDSLDLTTHQLPLLEETMYHAIYGNDKYVLISLK